MYAESIPKQRRERGYHQVVSQAVVVHCQGLIFQRKRIRSVQNVLGHHLGSAFTKFNLIGDRNCDHREINGPQEGRECPPKKQISREKPFFRV